MSVSSSESSLLRMRCTSSLLIMLAISPLVRKSSQTLTSCRRISGALWSEFGPDVANDLRYRDDFSNARNAVFFTLRGAFSTECKGSVPLSFGREDSRRPPTSVQEFKKLYQARFL